MFRFRAAPHMRLVVRHPASGFESVLPRRTGLACSVGPTGYELQVDEIASEPPFPIVTKGYEGGAFERGDRPCHSPEAVVRRTRVACVSAMDLSPLSEINQDLVDVPEDAARGSMPQRRSADPGLEIGYIDASVIQIYFDEAAAGDRTRVRGGAAPRRLAIAVTPEVAQGGSVEVTQGFTLKLGDAYDDAARVEFPVPIPDRQRDPETHRRRHQLARGCS